MGASGHFIIPGSDDILVVAIASTTRRRQNPKNIFFQKKLENEKNTLNLHPKVKHTAYFVIQEQSIQFSLY